MPNCNDGREPTPNNSIEVVIVNSHSLVRSRDRRKVIGPETPIYVLIDFVRESYPDPVLCQRVCQRIIANRLDGVQSMSIA